MNRCSVIFVSALFFLTGPYLRAEHMVFEMGFPNSGTGIFRKITNDGKVSFLVCKPDVVYMTENEDGREVPREVYERQCSPLNETEFLIGIPHFEEDLSRELDHAFQAWVSEQEHQYHRPFLSSLNPEVLKQGALYGVAAFLVGSKFNLTNLYPLNSFADFRRALPWWPATAVILGFGVHQMSKIFKLRRAERANVLAHAAMARRLSGPMQNRFAKINQYKPVREFFGGYEELIMNAFSEIYSRATQKLAEVYLNSGSFPKMDFSGPGSPRHQSVSEPR